MNPINQLVEISRFFGNNIEMVIAGGGNTSYKTEDKLWVKASGFALATITEDGFAVMDRKKLAEIVEKSYSTDPFERERQIKDDLAEATITKDIRPSVETSLHDIINYKFVFHLHPTRVNGVMCGKNAASVTEELFDSEVLYIPYADPGYILFKSIEEKLLNYRNEKGHDPNVILLQNHGIFVSADDPEEIKNIYNEVLSKIGNRIKRQPDLTEIEIKRDVVKFIPALRAMVSRDELKTLKIENNRLISEFITDQAAFEKISKPFSPDIIVYCKSKNLFINNTETPEEIIEEFSRKLQVFEMENGYTPKVVILKNYGLLTIGDNEKQAQIIQLVFQDAMKISLLSESFGGQNFMTPEQIQFIDTWEVENYRRKIASNGTGN